MIGWIREKPIEVSKTKKKAKLKCVVGQCDFIDEDGDPIAEKVKNSHKSRCGLCEQIYSLISPSL